MRTLSRGERNAHWIENFCVLPNGPNKGQRVVLTSAQRAGPIERISAHRIGAGGPSAD